MCCRVPSPQLISAALLLASTSTIALDLPFYSGPLHILAYMLYTIHLAISAEDFYWLAYTLSKARSLKAKVECKVNGGMKLIIYTP